MFCNSYEKNEWYLDLGHKGGAWTVDVHGKTFDKFLYWKKGAKQTKGNQRKSGNVEMMVV